MDDHEGDYDFDKIPYLENPKSIGYKRKAIVTPCVKEATTAYLIDQLLKQNYNIRGIAVPDSAEKVKIIHFSNIQSKIYILCLNIYKLLNSL